MVDFCADDTPELKAWRSEVRDFLEDALPHGMPFDFDYDEGEQDWADYLAFWRKVGAKGWIGLTWPTEYYGLGRSAIEKWILQEEFAAYGAPAYGVIGPHVAAALLRIGTPEQRRQHLKGIADASVLWAEGYSEPSAGSDLANLSTHARRDGDHWVLNGQKTLGTAAHRCQWMSVLARTDATSMRHHGISCLLVPLDAPGVQMLPLHNMAGGQQMQTYFEDVRLPADCLLGQEGQGWKQMWLRQGGESLDRAATAPDVRTFRILQMLRDIIAYCRTTVRDGRPMADDPVIRLQLAELILGVEVIKLHAYEAYDDSLAAPQARQPALAYFHQAYLKEFWPRLAQTCMEIVGPMAMISGGRWAQLEGRVEHYFRSSFANHAGGTSQVKRFMAATRGLGLPR